MENEKEKDRDFVKKEIGLQFYHFIIDFPQKLTQRQEDILISFFQQAVKLGVQESENMANKAKMLPGISKQAEMLDTIKSYMEGQTALFKLTQPSEKQYVFSLPTMKMQLIKLRGLGLSFPGVRTGRMKSTIENHVFKEMNINGKVEITEGGSRG